jgi:hypothetical protein
MELIVIFEEKYLLSNILIYMVGYMEIDFEHDTHYLYADEFYSMADRYGLAIIGETPAIGLIK